jgi:2-iminobutanoate/2-iminopropanoate deaminase
MQAISTPAAPKPSGHYAQAIVHGGVIYVAGMLSIDPATGAVVAPGEAGAQTAQALRNIAAVLEAAGSGLDQLLSATIFTTAQSQWAEVNAAFARLLGEHRPARAIVPVKELKPGCVVEIQVVAAARGA